MLEEIERWIAGGDIEAARQQARVWQPETDDPAVWARWAAVLDRLGMVSEALQAYQRALRRESRPEWHARLAELYLDLGKWSQAEEHLRQAIEAGSSDPDVFLALGELLEERGELDAARAVYHTALERVDHPVIRTRLKRLPAHPPADTALGVSVDDMTAAVFLQYFQGREGVYARQWLDRQGRIGYQPVQEPLTTSVLRRHLEGDITVGVYPVRLDNTVFFIVWDVDINRSVLEKVQRQTQRLAELARRTHEVAVQIADRCEQWGLPTLIEDSGFKGRHVWLFLAAPLEARIARTVAWRISRAVEIPPELHIDVFPRQDEVAPDQLGNLIKLPLGIHRKTGRRCLFLDRTGQAFPDQVRALTGTPRVLPERFIEAARSLTPVPAPSPPMPVEEREARAIQGAMAPPYHLEADPEFQTIVTCCPVLGTLVEKARRERMLTYDEQLVIVHTLGYLTRGVEAVNTVLGQCVNVYPQLILKSPLRGNPMSCPKIRQRIPHITQRTPCRCPERVEMGYPTPILFVRMMQSSPPGEWEKVHIQAVAETLIRLERERQRLEQQIQSLRRPLLAFLQGQPQPFLETPYGRVRLLSSEEGDRLEVELTPEASPPTPGDS